MSARNQDGNTVLMIEITTVSDERIDLLIHAMVRSMRKALFSGFKSEVTFADVILADILTSFARVFGDLAVSLCLMFLDRDGTNPDACYGSIVVPIMTRYRS